MVFLQRSSFRLALIAVLSIAVAPGAAQAQITGQTMGMTAGPVGPENAHPQTRDDTDVATTINITSLNTSALITAAAAAFPATLNNLVFAGAPGIGMNFTPIATSDFNILTYSPWVVNSPTVTSPGIIPATLIPPMPAMPAMPATFNRMVTDQDAGGASIVFTYTPAAGDPRTINFLQAFSNSFNGRMATVSMDNGGMGGPYYNQNGFSGVGTGITNGVPLMIPAGSNAYLLDSSYDCESGSTGTGFGCPVTTPANDETITSSVVTFNTFIEGDAFLAPTGQTYQVLYGGFTWGYTFTATDVPEPATWLMLTLGFGALGASMRRRARLATIAT